MRTNGLGDLSERKILDIGCGTGQWLLDLIRWGATPHLIVGVDLNGERLETERSRLPDLIRLSVADGSRLPFPDQEFELVIMATVLNSVLDSNLRRRIAPDAMRTLAPGGCLLFYDLANPYVTGVTRPALKE